MTFTLEAMTFLLLEKFPPKTLGNYMQLGLGFWKNAKQGPSHECDWEKDEEVKVGVARCHAKFPLIVRDVTKPPQLVEFSENYIEHGRSRVVSSTESTDFSCSINRIKPPKFKWMLYGVMFSDVIKLMRAPVSEVLKWGLPEQGDSSEYLLSMSRNKLNEHLLKYFYADLSYEELYNVITGRQIPLGVFDLDVADRPLSIASGYRSPFRLMDSA